MDGRYSLHRIDFIYNDEWYEPIGISYEGQIFDSFEEAEEAKKIANRQVLQELPLQDYFRDFLAFYQHDIEGTQRRVIAYAKAKGWDEALVHLKTEPKDTHQIIEFYPPNNATDDQKDELLQIFNASFYKILRYENLVRKVYVKLYQNFWGKDFLENLRKRGEIALSIPQIKGHSQKGYYLTKEVALEDRKIKFPSIEEAEKRVALFFADMLREEANITFFQKNKINTWSEHQSLLIAFLSNCKNFQILYNAQDLSRIEIVSSEIVDYNELLSLIKLLKMPPFRLIEQIEEIDGQKIS